MLYDDYTNIYDLVTYLENHLLGYLTPQWPAPPDGVPAASERYVPMNFRGRYPFMSVKLDDHSGRPRISDAPRWAPGLIVGFLRIYAPSISAPQDLGGTGSFDGRFQASESTRKVYSAFRNAFLTDEYLENRIGYLEITQNTEGDMDRMPAPLMEERQPGTDRRILWVNESRIALRFDIR